MLWVQKRDENYIVEVIDLSKVKKCILIPEYYRLRIKGKDEDLLHRINLEFYFVFEEKRIVLNLFDNEINYTQDLELKHAQKWLGIIKDQIEIQPLLKNTA